MELSYFERAILELTVWREMRSVSAAWQAVIWVILNRTANPGWWGHDIVSVCTRPWQFTSMTGHGDPNLTEYPSSRGDAVLAAIDNALMNLGADPTGGAVYYHSLPLTQAPAAWGPVEQTFEVAGVKFYRQAKQ